MLTFLMNLFRAIPQWLAGQLSEYVDNVDFDAVRVRESLIIKNGGWSYSSFFFNSFSNLDFSESFFESALGACKDGEEH